MKLVKLSLVAALAAGTLTTLNAKPLEEAIRGVDISGFAWYRYDTGRFTDSSAYNLDAGGIPYPQTHRYRVGLTTKVDMGEGFKAVGMLLYNSLDHSFATGSYAQGANTKQPIFLKQAFIQYDNADAGLTFTLGRQNLNTIWTDDLAGVAAKLLLRPTDGVTIAAFAVDNFQSGDDEATFSPYKLTHATDGTDISTNLTTRLFKENLYGAAVLGDFGPVKAEIWGANWDKTATLYALKLDYKLGFGDGDNFRVHLNYYGNVVDGVFQDDIKTLAGLTSADEDLAGNGNLANLKLAVKVSGFDANVGGIFFGKKKKFTLNTIEEPYGNDGDLYIGSEIFYQKGSWGVLSIGQSTYGYVGAGYTFPADIRFGIKGVYGETKEAGSTDAESAANGGGKKVEGLAELSWQVNRGLNLLAYYSYLHTTAKNGAVDDSAAGTYKDAKSAKNTIRFQAKYSF